MSIQKPIDPSLLTGRRKSSRAARFLRLWSQHMSRSSGPTLKTSSHWMPFVLASVRRTISDTDHQPPRRSFRSKFAR